MNDILLIFFGALLGANTRFLIYKKLQKSDFSKDLVILIINILASFCLGFSLSFLSKISSLNFAFQLRLFFFIGFLGSLSTFSTFIYDLFDLFSKRKFLRVLKLFIFSLTFGIISLAFGLLIGNQ